MTTKTKTRYMVKVVYWTGTRQCEAFCSTYAAAMRIAARNQNAQGPTFYDNQTGEQLFDDGNGLRDEHGIYTI